MAGAAGRAGGSFLQALRIQVRVLGALMMWEVITRYGRDNLGFIWLFLEPMLFTVAVVALWTGMGMAKTYDLPIFAFALTGYSPVLLWRNCASRCSNAIPASTTMFYHRPIRVLDILLTKILLECAGGTCSFLGLGLFWWAAGQLEPPDNVLVVLGGWILLAWFGAALALVLGALTALSELAERLWHPTAYILFPLSGSVFMVDWLSEEFRSVVLWLPMVHTGEIIRDGFFGSIVRTHYDVSYVLTANLLLTAAGLFLVRAVGRRMNYR